MLTFTLVMLMLAVVISIIGVANTMTLSVNERRRENAMLRSLGLSRKQLRRMISIEAILITLAAVVLGMVYDFLPFMVLPIYNVVSKIDNRLIEAAYDLGAGKFYVFRRVIFPLSIPGIASGVTMVFIPALTTFVISNMLGGGKINLIGKYYRTGIHCELKLVSRLWTFTSYDGIYHRQHAYSPEVWRWRGGSFIMKKIFGKYVSDDNNALPVSAEF